MNFCCDIIRMFEHVFNGPKIDLFISCTRLATGLPWFQSLSVKYSVCYPMQSHLKWKFPSLCRREWKPKHWFRGVWSWICLDLTFKFAQRWFERSNGRIPMSRVSGSSGRWFEENGTTIAITSECMSCLEDNSSVWAWHHGHHWCPGGEPWQSLLSGSGPRQALAAIERVRIL